MISHYLVTHIMFLLLAGGTLMLYMGTIWSSIGLSNKFHKFPLVILGLLQLYVAFNLQGV